MAANTLPARHGCRPHPCTAGSAGLPPWLGGSGPRCAHGGPIQPSLFDEADLAEFTHPDYPGERLVACRNPLLAEERSRKRGELLAATEETVAPIIAAVADGRLVEAANIAIKLGNVINKAKMAKHFDVAITDTGLTVTRRQESIDAEAALDGIYVLRTTITAGQLDACGVVYAYKNRANVEADFRHIKVDDLDLRPIHHRLEARYGHCSPHQYHSPSRSHNDQQQPHASPRESQIRYDKAVTSGY